MRTDSKPAIALAPGDLEELLANSPDYICLVDRDGRFVYVNQLEPGFRIDQIIGRRLTDLLPKDARRGVRRALRDVFELGEARLIENRYIDLKGRERWFENRYVPFKRGGAVVFAIAVARDITRHRETLRALQETQGRFGGFFQACLDAITFVDSTGRFLDVNPAFLRLTGYSFEEVVGKMTFQDLTPPEQHYIGRDAIRRLTESARALEFEKEYLTKDGRRVPVHLTTFPVRDSNGAPIGFSAIIRDISARRRAEQAVARHAASLELLRAVTAAANTAATADEAVQVCLDRVCALTGWPVGHAYFVSRDGKRLESARLWRLGEARRFERFRAATERTTMARGVGLPGRAWKTAAPVTVDDLGRFRGFPRCRAANCCGLNSGFAFPVLIRDQVVAVLEFFTRGSAAPDESLLDVMADVGTQLGRAIERERAQRSLRASEERFRLLVEGVRDYALFMLDTEGRIVSWNEGAGRILGFAAEEVMGRHPTLFCPPDVGPDQCRLAMETALAEGRFEEEAWRVRRDGRRIWTKTVVSAIRDDHGALRGFAVIMQDLTERKRLEREILEVGAREQTRIGQELHDSLGQTLTGVALLASALRDSLAGRGASEAAEARRIAAFANSAVSQSRELARGLLPSGLRSDGLAGALRTLARQAEELFRVDCVCRIETEPSLTDEVATLHLYRIAQEAVSNAAKHGRARRIRIVLSRSRGRLRLQVSDDGVGVPRGNGAQKGLGLDIMQYRARMLGASLDVRRGLKGGTVVACVYPLPAAA